MKTVHVLWFLIACSDSIADLLIAVYYFRVKKRFGTYTAIFMTGLSIEASMAAFSLIALWPGEVEVAPGFALFRTVGRTVKAVVAWIYVGYLFFWLNGDLKGS